MLRRIFFASLFVFTFSFAYSQNIEIKVIDKVSNKPVEDAEVYFPELNKTSITDSNGLFILKNAPNESIKVIVSSLGYRTYSGMIGAEYQEIKLEHSHFALKEVIVSVPTGKLQGEVVVSIEQRKIAELKENSPLTLAAAIGNLPGVDQNTTGNGIGKPVIRGLSGSRIVTYTQGIRLENQQWGSEHGLGVGDIGIDGVEVIKGPASLLYGADALGGVLYFNDEKYAKTNYIETYVESKYLSNGRANYSNAGFKLSKDRFSINVFGATNSSADYQVPNGKSVFNTRFDENNLKASIGYSNNNWISNLRYSYLRNNFGITEDDSIYNSSPVRMFELPFQTIVNNNVSFENTFFLKESKLNLILGYTSNNRKEFEDTESSPGLNMILQTSTFNLKWFSKTFDNKWSFILGSQGMYQNNNNYGEEMLIPDATTKDIGAFSLVNFKYKKVSLQGGLRVDNRNIHSSKFVDDTSTELFPDFDNAYTGINYSLGGAYSLEKSTFRINLSSGFRAPNTTELLANGEHEGSGQYLVGNKKLISENANQVDVEYSFVSEHFKFSVNPFVNKINNYIYLNPTIKEIDNTPVYEYKQTDAILYGGEIGFHYHPHAVHWLHLSSDLSTVFAEDKNGNNLPLIPQNRINSTIKASINNKGIFKVKNIFIQNTYKFEQSRIGLFETESPAYSLINLGANFEIENEHFPLEITTGINNLLNTEYIDHLSRFKPMGIQNQGVNFYIGIKFNFEHSI